MWRAFGMCAGIAFTAACGLSNEYAGPPVGGFGVNGPGGSNGVGSTGGTVSSNGGGGQTGSSSGNGGNGVNGVNGVGTTTNGFGGTSNGNGPGGNGPGGGVGSSTGIFFVTSGGSTGGGTTTGGGEGCTEFASCNPSVGCGCGYSCVFEPLKGGFACEDVCTDTEECPDTETVCNGASCTINLCGMGIGGPPNGTFDGSCDSEGTNDGTCVPVGDGGFGVCFQSGTSDGGCDPGATRPADGTLNPNLCVPGDTCALDFATGIGYECYTLCVPGFGNGGNQHCMDEGFSICLRLTDEVGVCL